MLPAVPLESSRAANRGRTTSEKPAPRYDVTSQSGLRGSNQIGATSRSRKLGSLPRLCWPLVGIKRSGLCRPSAPAVLDRSAGPLPGRPCALSIHNGIGLLPFRDPTRASKGISSAHHRFLETRKGVPTNWAGTPDAPHLDLYTRFAKGILAKFPRQDVTIGLPVSGLRRCRTGSGFPPSPRAPWSRKSPPD